MPIFFEIQNDYMKKMDFVLGGQCVVKYMRLLYMPEKE